MKTAVIIPDKNDRPEFLEMCLKMVFRQTVKPDRVVLMNSDSQIDGCDITWRYRNGYDSLRNQGFDLVFLMENDDWYSPHYIETMVKQYKEKPADIIGTSYTIYYHIGLRKWMQLTHPARSSAMSTVIRADLEIEWGNDSYAYTDLTLWKQLNGYTFTPEKHICLGIKHGTTVTGGKFHNDRLDTYTNNDEHLFWLAKNTNFDYEILNFYGKFYNEKIHS